MERGYPPGGLDNFDDPPPNRAQEEAASRHILLAMIWAAMTLGGIYGLCALFNIIASGV